MIRRHKHQARIVCHKRDGDNESEDKPEKAVEDAGRILREVLEAEHNNHHIPGIDDPETGGG